MHIQVLRGPFLSTLAQIQGVIEAKRTLPILSHLLLEANGLDPHGHNDAAKPLPFRRFEYGR